MINSRDIHVAASASTGSADIRRYKLGVGIDDCEDIVFSGNNIAMCPTGMSLKNSRGLVVTGNVVSGSSQSISTEALTDAVVENNNNREAAANPNPGAGAESSAVR